MIFFRSMKKKRPAAKTGPGNIELGLKNGQFHQRLQLKFFVTSIFLYFVLIENISILLKNSKIKILGK